MTSSHQINIHSQTYARWLGIIAEFADALAPGSYLVVSVGCVNEETGARLIEAYNPQQLFNHPPDKLLTVFAGLDLVPLGLSDAAVWSPGAAASSSGSSDGRILACVACKPS